MQVYMIGYVSFLVTLPMYPATNVTTSCSALLQSDRGLGTTYLYRASTVLSKHANFIMV